ncbi:site-specific DNA-methyltransferase [uncultured Psychrobacter sp.]|uniref:DNA-methyltransferase n=1 Tax=uncultured Psychrobacter sp. TaxID=259303 RepID=UPI0025936C74|nr:site-specific DNA-methyltransferase [uncultured Psychrobacter sp.]
MFKLWHGDCLELMKDIPDGSVDLILTDPPYGTTQCKWDSVINLNLMWQELKRVARPNAAIVMTAVQPFTTTLISSNIKMFKYDWVYCKTQATNFLNAKKQPLRNHESVLVFYRKQPTYNPQMTNGKPYSITDGKKSQSVSGDADITNGGHRTVSDGKRYPLSVMSKITSETGLHPTQKPVALMEYLIKTYTHEGDTVLDFTMGSGSTGVACAKTNRGFIGIELDRDYYDIAVNRINEAKETANGHDS